MAEFLDLSERFMLECRFPYGFIVDTTAADDCNDEFLAMPAIVDGLSWLADLDMGRAKQHVAELKDVEINERIKASLTEHLLAYGRAPGRIC